MTGAEIAVVASMGLVAVTTFYLGRRSTRHESSGAGGLGLARRTVLPRRNASAMSGEFLCVVAVLGIAGAVLSDGADAIWYPVGFTAGFLAVMIFVAAPLRRSGAYTLPDFVEARLGSARLRGLASTVVVTITLLYLLPQLHGARLTFTTLLPVPDWAGPVALTVVVLLTVLGGGMRAVTVSLAFQYWLKLFAIAAPTLVLLTVFAVSSDGSGGLGEDQSVTFAEQTTVTVRTPVSMRATADTAVRVDGVASTWFTGSEHTVAADSTLEFAPGAPVPSVAGTAETNRNWLFPADGDVDLLHIYSLLIALALGTVGLPHILVRFYTNPDGTAARRTALHVVALVGMFYVFTLLLGGLARLYTPELLMTGSADAAVLLLPSAMLPGLPGQILVTVIVAAVFSAFLAAAAGLVFSVAGVVSRRLPGRVRDVRPAAAVIALLALGVATWYPPSDLADAIVWPFALAASTFCPVLVLGVWWRGLTATGAGAAMLVGGGLVLASFGLTQLSAHLGFWIPEIVQHPAIVSVPLAFATAVLMSLATRSGIPSTVNASMLRMHAPDTLGFIGDTPQTDKNAKAGEGKHRR